MPEHVRLVKLLRLLKPALRTVHAIHDTDQAKVLCLTRMMPIVIFWRQAQRHCDEHVSVKATFHIDRLTMQSRVTRQHREDNHLQPNTGQQRMCVGQIRTDTDRQQIGEYLLHRRAINCCPRHWSREFMMLFVHEFVESRMMPQSMHIVKYDFCDDHKHRKLSDCAAKRWQWRGLCFTLLQTRCTCKANHK